MHGALLGAPNGARFNVSSDAAGSGGANRGPAERAGLRQLDDGIERRLEVLRRRLLGAVVEPALVRHADGGDDRRGEQPRMQRAVRSVGEARLERLAERMLPGDLLPQGADLDLRRDGADLRLEQHQLALLAPVGVDLEEALRTAVSASSPSGRRRVASTTASRRP